MISASYHPSEYRHDKRTREGFRTYKEAMAWIMADATSRYTIESNAPHHGLWFWYKLYKNGEQTGASEYLIRPLLRGKNKGKPAMFRYSNRYDNYLYRLKSKYF